jgi:predicted MFS family arabinose efflux permease
MASPQSSTPPIPLWRLLAVILFSRTILDMAVRGLYPFLPYIAADLRVSYGSVAQMVQARNLVGLAAPLMGPFSDRYGRRTIMLAGLGAVSLASIALLFSVPLPVIVLLTILVGLGLVAYVPAQQAYLGDVVPYAQRGRAMALGELAWSVSAIVGLPLMGYVLSLYGWRWAFGAVGFLGVTSWFLLRHVLPPSRRQSAGVRPPWSSSLGTALRAPSALAAISVALLVAAMNEHINISFAVWMRDAFALDARALGLVAAGIGAAELASELFAAAFVDRIGKWRMVALTLGLGAVGYCAMALLGGNVWLASGGLALIYFVFELTVVSIIPLVSELAPEVRASLLSLQVGAFSLGRALGSFSGPALFAEFGFQVTSVVSAGGAVAALVVWLMFVRERHGTASASLHNRPGAAP